MKSGPERQREIYVEGRRQLPLDFETLEWAARSRLNQEAFDYVAGGAGRETTMESNRRALDEVAIVPRMLRDVSRRDLELTLFGQKLSAPFFLCPIGVLDLVHPQADGGSARAAAAHRVPAVFSNQASVAMEECSALMGDSPRWFQLYWSKRNELVESLVKRAEACGCSAIVVTLDTTMLGWRVRDLDLGFLPFLFGRGIAQYVSDPVFAQLMDEPMDPVEPDPPLSLARVKLFVDLCKRYPGPFWENFRSKRPIVAVRKFIQLYSRPSLQWDDLEFLRSCTSLPIVLKGILHADDALKALDHGVDGVYVSNHGGRQVDGAIGAAAALPSVAAAVDGRVPVLFDSGVRCGADIFKALALGATAVGIGRPYAYALALGGYDGVYELLANYRAELDLTMGLAGCVNLSEIGPQCL